MLASFLILLLYAFVPKGHQFSYATPLTIYPHSQLSTGIEEAESGDGESHSRQIVREAACEVSECINSHYVLLTNSRPPTLINHFGLSENVDLLKRTFVVINPITDEVMKLRTPWPMVFGQTIFSLAMAWFGRSQKRDPNRQPNQLLNPPVYKQIIWAVNMVRSTGAAIIQMIQIIKGGRREIPSVGEAIVFATMLVGSFSFVSGVAAQVAGYVGIVTNTIGLLFYITSGILAWVSNGISTPCSSQGFGLPEGCTFDNSSALYSVPCTSISWSGMTSGDWAYFVGWAMGAAWFGRIRSVDTKVMNQFTIAAMGVGGVISCTSAGFTAYYAKNPSGFWNLWVQDKAQVVKSLFTW